MNTFSLAIQLFYATSESLQNESACMDNIMYMFELFEFNLIAFQHYYTKKWGNVLKRETSIPTFLGITKVKF